MRKSVFIFGLLLCLTSCSTSKVSLDYDRNQNFSELRDFRIEFLENSMNEIEQNRMKEALKKELSFKNMQFDENSDVLLTVFMEEYISERRNSELGFGVQGGLGTSIGFGMPITSQKLNKHYVISLYNSNNQMVWIGNLEIEMSRKANPDAIETNLNKGIRKLFKNFPPKVK